MSAHDDRAARFLSDPRSDAELIRLVLSKDADADDDDFWQPVWILQHRLPRVFDDIEKLSRSGDAKARDVAATLLGQNGVRHKVLARECADVLLAMLRSEAEVGVICSIAFALGHLHEVRAVEAVLDLVRHPDADVRYAVVHSLSGLEDDRAVAALIELSADADRDVRNWATFGLGSLIDMDTPALREALVARLSEDDGEIRGEALVGLASRGDVRIIPVMLRELEIGNAASATGGTLLSEAGEAIAKIAAESGAVIWQPVLEKLSQAKTREIEALESEPVDPRL